MCGPVSCTLALGRVLMPAHYEYPEGELRDMVEKDEPAEVYCHFCVTRYHLPVERLRKLLETGRV